MLARGHIVFDVADPTHLARIEQINHRPHASVAKLVWLDTGWKSYGVPLTDLERAPQDEMIDSQTRAIAALTESVS